MIKGFVQGSLPSMIKGFVRRPRNGTAKTQQGQRSYRRL